MVKICIKIIDIPGRVLVITIVVIAISLLLIAFNAWRIIRKYSNRDINEFAKLPFFYGCILNILCILVGLYFILMVLGQVTLLKILTLLFGLLFIIQGAFVLAENARNFKQYKWITLLLIKSAFPLLEIIIGILFILLSIASLK